MKFIFLKTGDYLEMTPNKSAIAAAWFDYIFSNNMNMCYSARDTTQISQANTNISKVNAAVDIVNKFSMEKNLPSLMFDKINGLDQNWMNNAHKKWVKCTNEYVNIVLGDEVKQHYPWVKIAWQDINTFIHSLENYYSIWFANSKDSCCKEMNIEIRPEDCEYAQRDLVLRFEDLGKHQFDQWRTGSAVDDETSNYKRIPTRFEYKFDTQLPKGTLPTPHYIDWCKQNNLQVMPPWIILGDFKKDVWQVKQIMHQNLSRDLQVGFEL